MLNIKNLTVKVEQKKILENINLNFQLGKNYGILGKNGSGKSSLAMSIMGNPKYKIISGDIQIDTKSIKKLSPDQRAKQGIFLAFQHIPEIKGVKVFEFLRSIYDAKNGGTTSFLSFKKIIQPILTQIKLDKEFLRRDLNVGFSGGERRKFEILQVQLLQPKYIFLDEIDSGLDIDAFKSVIKLLSTLNTKKNSFIIITHLFKILEKIPVDYVYVLDGGKLVNHGNKKIIDQIKKYGFEKQTKLKA
ncbi:MAG: Fe-S cluster assembly ATPase SufC [Candidatus Absconditabacterales bacterium]